jgi:hypothetical protein
VSKYRPIDVRLWNDRKFLSLSDDARLLWMFLMTTSSTLPIPGVVIGGDAALAEQLGWLPERFAKRFQELSRNGLAVRKEGRFVWLVNALKYQPPSNPNVMKGWARYWDDVPESALKHELWQALKVACKSWSRRFDELFAEPFTEPFRDGLGNGYTQDQDQDQDQEQEQEQDKTIATPPARASRKRTPRVLSPGEEKIRTEYQAATDAYFQRFEAAYGQKPGFLAKHGAQINRLLKAHGLVEFLRRLEILFTSPPNWLKGPYDLGTLESQFDKLIQPSLSVVSVKQGRIEPHTAEAYADGEVAL